MKLSIQKLQLLFLTFIGLYPLLKPHWSSKILIAYCLVIVFQKIKEKSFNFSVINIKKFMFMAGYFLLIIFSFFYSDNKPEAINKTLELSPLLIIPFIISFSDIEISTKAKNNILTIFTLANVIYTLIILYYAFTNIDNLSNYLLNYESFQILLSQKIGSRFLFHKPYFSMGFVFCAIFSLKMIFGNFYTNKKTKMLFVLSFLYFFVCLFYVFSFPNVIALVLSTICFFIKELKIKQMMLFLTIMVILCSSFLFVKAKDNDLQKGFNFIKTSLSQKKYESNDPRIEIYKSFYIILKESDFFDLLFGKGIGDVQDLLNEQYNKRLNFNKSKNLLYYSEEFQKNYWFKDNIEIYPNKIKPPLFNNTYTADIVSTKQNGNDNAKSISLKLKNKTQDIHTFSVFAKKNESNNICLTLGNTSKQNALFDLNKGLIIEENNIIKATIKKLPNNWYRCSITNKIDTTTVASVKLPNNTSTFLWGAQLEKGKLTSYERNNKELLQYTFNNKLNTHNNYLMFFISIGILGLIGFLSLISYLFYVSIKPYDILRLCFTLTISLNFLTENIFDRQWGLIFFSFFLIILFNQKELKIE